MATILPDSLPPSDQSPSSEEEEAIPEDNDNPEQESDDGSLSNDSLMSADRAEDNGDDEAEEDNEVKDPGHAAAFHVFDRLSVLQWPNFDALFKQVNDEAEVLGFGLVKRCAMRRDATTGQYRVIDVLTLYVYEAVPQPLHLPGSDQILVPNKKTVPLPPGPSIYRRIIAGPLALSAHHNHAMSFKASNIAVHRRRKRT